MHRLNGLEIWHESESAGREADRCKLLVGHRAASLKIQIQHIHAAIGDIHQFSTVRHRLTERKKTYQRGTGDPRDIPQCVCELPHSGNVAEARIPPEQLVSTLT